MESFVCFIFVLYSLLGSVAIISGLYDYSQNRRHSVFIGPVGNLVSSLGIFLMIVFFGYLVFYG